MSQKLTDLLNISSPTIANIDLGAPTTQWVTIDQLPEPVEEQSVKIVDQDERDFENDFELVRDNLKELVTKGDDALDSILDIATMSLQPRAFEIAAAALKTLVESNLSLLDIHEKRKKIKGPKETAKPAGGVVNNIENAVLFSGSTSDILKRLKK